MCIKKQIRKKQLFIRWVDGSKLDYQHWEDGDPHNDANKNSVQIIGNQEFANRDSHLLSLHIGRWSNTQCERHNLNILYEKTQDITFAKLARILFELKKKYEKEKKELKDTIAEMQTVEGVLRHRIKEIEKNETDLKNEVNELKNEIKETGFAPNNTIYVQYPFELEPKNVWNCSRNGK